MHVRPVRLLVALGVASALALTTTGCGGDDSGPRESPAEHVTAVPAAEATATPPADAEVVAITIQDGKVDPSGAGVDVAVGQPVVLNIDADGAGELHVHSTPEQVVEFPEGTSTITLTFEQPGVVDVEDHGLDKLIVQLEVS